VTLKYKLGATQGHSIHPSVLCQCHFMNVPTRDCAKVSFR